MLLDNFYTTVKIHEISDNELIADIILNPKHEIYHGHFPGNPVVPGVVSVQIINEILSEHIRKKLMTSKAGNIKFPAMINPAVHPLLNVNIKFSENNENGYKVNAQIYFKEIIFLKFKGSFSVIY